MKLWSLILLWSCLLYIWGEKSEQSSHVLFPCQLLFFLLRKSCAVISNIFLKQLFIHCNFFNCFCSKCVRHVGCFLKCVKELQVFNSQRSCKTLLSVEITTSIMIFFFTFQRNNDKKLFTCLDIKQNRRSEEMNLLKLSNTACWQRFYV